jgi:hypothetical protein
MTLFVPRTFSNQEEWTRQSSGVINQLVNRQVAVDTFTTTQTLDYNHDVALCDATSAAFTVTLPKAALHPRRDLIVKKVDASGNAVTVEADGAETIDGAANVSLSGQWDFVQVISDGTSWSVIAENASSGGGGTTDDPLTINNSGSGAASGATFDGSAPVTISYNTVGAAASSHTHTQANVTGLTTADSPQFAGVNVGHASDTTITRASAGVIAVEGSNVVTVAGGTFTGDISVPDEAYDATNWNGSTEVPTKNAVRDKIETLSAGGRVLISELAADSVATTFTFSAIAGTYKRLIVEAWLTIPSNATFTIRCNNDSTALYQMQRTGHENGAINLQQLTQTSWNPTNATFNTGVAVDFELSLGNYASANKKLARIMLAAGTTGTGNLATASAALLYDSATAVSRLDFIFSGAPTAGQIRLFGSL